MTVTSADEIEQAIRQLPIGAVDLDQAKILIAEQFVSLNNNPEGIRGPHAIDAVKQGSVDWYDLDGALLGVAARTVAIARPYLMVLELASLKPSEIKITGAWRLYDIEATSPTRAFALLLEQFGLIGSQPDGTVGRFVGMAHFDHNEQPTPLAIESSDKGSVRLTMTPRVNSDRSTDIAWCYAFDDDAYLSYVRNRR